MDTLIKACVSSASYFLPDDGKHSDMVETAVIGSAGSSALSGLHSSSGTIFTPFCASYTYPRPKIQSKSPPVTSTTFSSNSTSALTVSTSNTSPSSNKTLSTVSGSRIIKPLQNSSNVDPRCCNSNGRPIATMIDFVPSMNEINSINSCTLNSSIPHKEPNSIPHFRTKTVKSIKPTNISITNQHSNPDVSPPKNDLSNSISSRGNGHLPSIPEEKLEHRQCYMNSEPLTNEIRNRLNNIGSRKPTENGNLPNLIENMQIPKVVENKRLEASEQLPIINDSLIPSKCIAQDSLSCTSPVNSKEDPRVGFTHSHPQDDRWVRPLGYAERFMTSASNFGNMTTVYSLWLESRNPIYFETIKKTASIMYRKMPNLRMSVTKRNGQLWWREMATEKVDVEALKSDDVIKTFELLLRKRYRLDEGPLWFIRLVSLDNGERDDNHNLNHRYVCIFGFHHNVSDGTTNMKFCKIFLSVLNNLQQKKAIDMQPEGIFTVPLHNKIADEYTEITFLIHHFLHRFYKGILSYGTFVNNFTKYYSMPRHEGCRTHILLKELDEVTTSKLLKRCRMERVTLNSAFTAAANLGLYNLIMKKTKHIRSTNFESVQAVNMRRYWPKDSTRDTFGCNISMLDMTVPTVAEDIDNFWDYARRVHDIIRHELNVTKRALKVTPLSERLCLIIRNNWILSLLGLKSTNDNHYCVTNMGDLSSTFPGVGEEVQVSRVVRSVSGHFMPTLCQHTLQTFKGRFCYSLDYYSQKMTPEVAKMYVDELIGILERRIHTPN